ncbi:MAG: ABC transporter permease [Candidatus Woesearchaeota archaeon]
MSALIELIRKNLLLLVRARASASIVVFGPMLVIFVAGLAFDNIGTYNVRVGVYSAHFNELSESFVQTLSKNSMKISRFDSENSCVDAVRGGALHTCIVFSPDFTLGKDAANELSFHIDPSKINLVWVILESLSSAVAERTRELSLNLTSVAIRAIEITDNELSGKKPVVIQLATENEEVSQKASEIRERLGRLDLGINKSAFGIEVMSKRQEDIQNHLEELKAISNELVGSVAERLNRAKDLVESSELNSTIKENITEALARARNSLSSFVSTINLTMNATTTSFAEVNASLQNLVYHVETTANKLQAVEETRNRVFATLEAAKAELDSSLLGIASIQNSLNKISSILSMVQIREPEKIVQPITTVIKPVVAQKTYLNYIFPILVILILMFTALLLAPTLILLEKKSAAFFRNFMAPTPGVVHLGSVFISSGIILILQLAVLLGIAAIGFKAQITTNIVATAIILFILLILFITLGMILGYLFNSEETAMLAAIALGSVFLFLSDIIIPIETMPPAIEGMAKLNPLILGGLALRRAIIFGATLQELWKEVAILGGYILVAGLFVLAAYLSGKSRQKNI